MDGVKQFNGECSTHYRCFCVPRCFPICRRHEVANQNPSPHLLQATPGGAANRAVGVVACHGHLQLVDACLALHVACDACLCAVSGCLSALAIRGSGREGQQRLRVFGVELGSGDRGGREGSNTTWAACCVAAAGPGVACLAVGINQLLQPRLGGAHNCCNQVLKQCTAQAVCATQPGMQPC